VAGLKIKHACSGPARVLTATVVSARMALLACAKPRLSSFRWYGRISGSLEPGSYGFGFFTRPLPQAALNSSAEIVPSPSTSTILKLTM
jgi:hypothetical protein